MIDAFFRAIQPLQTWIFEAIVQPLLYQLGLMTWVEPAYSAVEFFILGVLELVLIYLLVRPLETLRPAEAWDDRRGLGTDVLYTLLNRLGIIPLGVFFLLLPLVDTLDGWLRLQGLIPGNLEDLFPSLASHPVLSFAAYLVIFDLSEYVKHRLQHRFNWWWALHSLHHSQRKMSLWTDNRNHLLDDLLGGIWTASVALLVGVAPAQFVFLVLTARFFESLSHANTRLSFGESGRYLVVSPLFHRTHHAIGLGHEGGDRGCNFSVLFPIWDILFRTASFQPVYLATGIRDQLEGKDYGETFIAQQIRGVERLYRAVFKRRSSEAATP